ncbi:Flp family type IVb pilin [Spongiibacter tropicus]|uniref:Flp family type IVb pilin n=1 Tax=Spongiibacter tropicus TaxID=454602 RepID=UPI0003B5912C|nr:Flp family type IVb pilin [Spongiibacter tropicus]
MMLKLISKGITKFRKDEEGASAIEYAIMAAVLIVAIIAAVGLLDLQGIFTDINTSIDNA